MRDVVARLPADVEEALAGRGVRRTEPHRHRPAGPCRRPPSGWCCSSCRCTSRGRSGTARRAGASVCRSPGSRLASSSSVGVRVISCSRSSVRWSTYPVSAIPRFSWKPFTRGGGLPVPVSLTLPKYHAIWRSRACRSRTFGPVVAGPRRRRAGLGDLDRAFGCGQRRGHLARRGSGRGVGVGSVADAVGSRGGDDARPGRRCRRAARSRRSPARRRTRGRRCPRARRRSWPHWPLCSLQHPCRTFSPRR